MADTLLDIGATPPNSVELFAPAWPEYSLAGRTTGSDNEVYKLATDARNIDHGIVATLVLRDAIPAVHGDLVAFNENSKYRWDESLAVPAWVSWNGTDAIAPNPKLDPVTGTTSWRKGGVLIPSVIDYIPTRYHESIRDRSITDDMGEYLELAFSSLLSLEFPEGLFPYSRELTPQRSATIRGAGKYTTTLQSTGVTAIRLGNDANTDDRFNTIQDIEVVSDTYPAVRVKNSLDYSIESVNISGGLRVSDSVRGRVQNCRVLVSGNWAILCDGFINGISIYNNVVSGGGSGGAINLMGPNTNAEVRKNIIESSRNGIWIGSDPIIAGVTGAGSSRGCVVANNYIEQSETPIVIGVNFIFRNGSISHNIIGNTQNSIIPKRGSSIKLGRLTCCEIIGNSIQNLNSENPIEIVLDIAGDFVNNAVQCNTIENSNNAPLYSSLSAAQKTALGVGSRVVGSDGNTYNLEVDASGNLDPVGGVDWSLNSLSSDVLISGALAGSGSTKWSVGAANYLDVLGRRTVSGIEFPSLTSSTGPKVFESGSLNANETVPALAWNDGSEVFLGGRIAKVEIFEAIGDLTGCRLQLGRAGSTADVTNLLIDTLTLVNGRAEVPFVSSVRAQENSTYRAIAGTGTGRFRIRITYRAT